MWSCLYIEGLIFRILRYLACESGLSLRGRVWGFSSATMNVAPGCFHRKIEEEYNQKKSLAV